MLLGILILGFVGIDTEAAGHDKLFFFLNQSRRKRFPFKPVYFFGLFTGFNQFFLLGDSCI